MPIILVSKSLLNIGECGAEQNITLNVSHESFVIVILWGRDRCLDTTLSHWMAPSGRLGRDDRDAAVSLEAPKTSLRERGALFR